MRADSPAAPGPLIRSLTSREAEILRCLGRGLDTESISGELGITRTTVRNHVQSILRKLGVHTKLAAVLQAQGRDLI